MKKKIVLFSGRANQPLARKIAKELGLKLSEIQIEKFSDQETHIVTRQKVRGKHVFLVQSTGMPANENIMELLIMADALKDLKPKRITAVIPFFGYRRQEKQREDGESLTFALIARLLKAAGITKVIVMELHKHRSAKFFREQRIACTELSAFDEMIRYLRRKKIENFVVLAPDKGSMPGSKKYARELDVPLVYAKKYRDPKKKDRVEFGRFVGKVKDKNILIIDDEINTAGTLMGVVDILKRKKARNVYFACTHAILSGPAIERLRKAKLRQVIVTDTLYLPPKKRLPKIKVLSTAKIFAQAIAHAKK